MLQEHRGDAAGRPAAGHPVRRPGDVGREEDEDERGEARDAADGIRRLRAPAHDDERTDERPDEVADPVHAAEGRQCPRAHRDRHGLGEVGLPGQPEEGAGEADDEHADEEHDETARERRHEHADRLDDGGDEQRAPLTDARGERARRQVAEQLARRPSSRRGARPPRPRRRARAPTRR